jgi:hypothetical protein
MKRRHSDIDEINGTQVKRSRSTTPIIRGVIHPSNALRPNPQLKRDLTSNGWWQHTFVDHNIKTTPTPAADTFSGINSDVCQITAVQPLTEFEYASQIGSLAAGEDSDTSDTAESSMSQDCIDPRLLEELEGI